MAERVHLPPTTDAGVIEQFDGYFELADLPFELDENDMPRYPKGYHHYNLEGTKLLKQADVVMLTYVLPDDFDDAVKRANYDFYEPRTLHKSSLSPAVHSIMGIEVGDPSRALQYFRRAAFVDLIDNQGNTGEGIHIASAGGTWQMMVCGFGGFRVRNGQHDVQTMAAAGLDGHLLPARLARQHGRGADPAGLRDLRADRPGRRAGARSWSTGGSARCRPVSRSWSS